MKRTDYETLAMEEIVVEMENGFLAASKEEIDNKKINVTISDQEEESDFAVTGWD